MGIASRPIWFAPPTAAVTVEESEDTMSETQSVQGSVETALPGKPFYRRTEWWLTIIAIVFGGLLGSGVLGIDSIAAHISGMIVTALAAVGYTVGRTIAKSSDGLGRPGYKSSEFWTSLASGGLVAVQGAGLLQSGSQAEAILSAVLTVLPTLTYAIGRGKVKSDAFLLVLILAIGLPACSGWQVTNEKYFAAAHAVFEKGSTTGQDYFEKRCQAEAIACRDARRAAEAKGDAPAVETALSCPLAKNCLDALSEFDKVCVSGELAVLDGLALTKLGEAVAAKDVKSVLERVKGLASAVQTTLSDLGVTP